MIQAQFSSGKVYSTSNDAFSLYQKSRFGERKRDKIEYSFVEALFLLEQEKMEIFSGKSKLNEYSFIKKAKRNDKKIELKIPVFRSMREKGYILKTALKFGTDFRVYKKGVKPGQDHSPWLLHCVKENETQNWQEFAAKNRVAHSTKKKLLIAVVDDEDDVTFFETSWLKP